MLFSVLAVSLGNQTFAQSVEVNTTHVTDPIVILETSFGHITIEFFQNDAPNHVENFLKLASSGFYDETLFHRIIPKFMVQGGDPNTVSGDSSTWGIGGPTERVNAEFNTIKHNRGIVSMARSTDPNSAGSQFFIVHGDSNFLDGQYTAFGRIVTDESFETIDKIASVETGKSDIPLDAEAVRITAVKIINRSEVSNILELPEPDRTESATTSSTTTSSATNQKYESLEHDVSIMVPEGWLLQTPDKTDENSPDLVAVGPKVGVMNPVISLTVKETNQRSLDDLIVEENDRLEPAINSENLNILSKEKKTINGLKAYEINAESFFSTDTETLTIKFKQMMIYSSEKFYILTYLNSLDNFDSQLPQFEETLGTFTILSDDGTPQDLVELEENGGCLIATAAFGSELAPQVQQLREIRDNTLLSTASGVAFMSGFNQLYYSFSPTIADMERQNPMFKEFVKISITPLLSTLSIMENANSESQVLAYGATVILANIGMYFVAPAIIIYKIKKII